MTRRSSSRPFVPAHFVWPDFSGSGGCVQHDRANRTIHEQAQSSKYRPVTYTYRLHEDEATFVINHNHSKTSSGPFSTYSLLTQAPGNLTCLFSRVLLVSFIQPAKVQYLSPNGRGTLPFPVVLISL
jgi:hypothetical protein